MHLPENLRNSLKKPLGLLLADGDVTKENILKNIPKGAFLITVGDATTEKMISFGIDPPLQIVDSLEKRHRRDVPGGRIETTFECENPPAEITDESIKVIKAALGAKPPARIIVRGEEDLLVLPVAVYAPQNSVILYGQPNEGLVIVRVDDTVREMARKLMSQMH
ncbi:MAG TPA: GTP-dependent dephospho-CoA kinase family protein [Candidatus Nitrosotalea sp.]|nr:GTP-dependent dephospho-CoA kinase family protein [Candidatus Nitrosotalea sp.]